MLEAGVFTLGVFTDEGEIDTSVASGVARDIAADGDRSINIQLLTKGDIEGGVFKSRDGGVKNSYCGIYKSIGWLGYL